jgi:hypothetical protein
MELTRLLDRETLDQLEFGVALLGAGLLLVELLLHRLAQPLRAKRLRDGLLAGAGIVAALCWWDFFRFQVERDIPALRWVSFTDSFHYYAGPKYFAELGYVHLYECAALAEQQLGAGATVARRTYRDLASNEFVTGRELLGAARSCPERFSPERWQLFVHDVDWFRRRVPHWEATLQDWGYNATPAWNALGSLLAGSGPVSEQRLAWLTLLDVPLLLAMWGLVAWAFGWRTACVALIFWGTHQPNAYLWTGGSILRQEWLFASVAGVCLLRRRKPLAAGAAIAYATSLSIFPGFLAAGIGARAVAQWASERRLALSQEQRRLLLGAVLALAIVLPAAALGGAGASAWLAFVANSRADSQPSPNNMGLPTLLSWDGDTRLRLLQLGDSPRPVQLWSEARRETLAARTPLWAALVGAWLVLAMGAARRQPDWVAAILGVGFVVFAFQLSCYYYAFMLLFGLLWPRHRSIGIALCGLAAASHWIGGRFADEEEQYVRLSLLAVLLVGYVTLVLRFARDAQPPLRAPRAPA